VRPGPSSRSHDGDSPAVDIRRPGLGDGLRPNFGGSAVERGDRAFAVALLVAGVTASVVVTGIVVALRPNPAAPRPAAPSALVALPPVAPPPVTSLSTPVPVITSTVSGTGPLALFWTSSSSCCSVTLAARTYSGRPAGTLVLPSSTSGFEIAPNGMRVLNGNQIVAVSGAVLEPYRNNIFSRGYLRYGPTTPRISAK
jgi:hypothetical protein